MLRLRLATHPSEPPFALALLRLVQLLRLSPRTPLERATRDAAYGLRVDRPALHRFVAENAERLRAAARGRRTRGLLAPAVSSE